MLFRSFTNLNVESGTSAFPAPTNDGDLPVSDIVRDDQKGTLYVSTDFGVFVSGNFGTTEWGPAGTGLPPVAVYGLTINLGAGSRVLYAATHGRSAWSLALP